jgi:hypothetical protein
MNMAEFEKALMIRRARSRSASEPIASAFDAAAVGCLGDGSGKIAAIDGDQAARRVGKDQQEVQSASA